MPFRPITLDQSQGGFRPINLGEPIQQQPQAPVAPSLVPQPSPQPGFFDYLNPVGEHGFIKNAMVPAAQGIYKNTAEPIVDLNLDLVGTATAGMKGLGAQLSSGFDEQKKNAAMAEPVEIFGKDRNLFSNDTGAPDIGKTAYRGAGDLSKGLSGVFNTATMGNPALVAGHQFLPNFAAGAGMSAGQQMRDDQPIDWGQAGASGVLQGLLAKITSPKIKKESVGTKEAFKIETPAEEKALRSGVPMSTAKAVENLSPEEAVKFDEFSKAAYNAANNPRSTGVKGATANLADDFNKGMDKLWDIKSQQGASIGSIKEGFMNSADDVILNVEKSKNQLLQAVLPGGAYVDDAGKLAFSTKSSFLDGDQKLLTTLWDGLADSSSPWDLQLLKDKLGNMVYSGRGQSLISSPAEGIVKSTLGTVDDVLRQYSPDLADLNDAFSELAPALTAESKTTGNALQGWKSGVNSWNFLRRSLGAGNQSNYALLSKLQALGQKYNIPELSNILRLNELAQTADDMFRVGANTQPTSLTSILTKVAGDFAQGNQGNAAKHITAAALDKQTLSQNAAISALIKEGQSPHFIQWLKSIGARIPFAGNAYQDSQQ